MYQPYARPSQRHGPPSNRPAPGRATDSTQRPAELLPQLLQGRLSSSRPRRYHEVQVLGHFRDARVKHLSELPPHGVSGYRVADPSGNGEAQSRGAVLVGKSVHREEPAPVSGALAVYPLELGRVGQTHAFAAWQSSDCQALAAPAPAVRDDPASSHRTHAFAEAVRLGSLATIWLISTLHRTPLQALRSTQTTKRVYPKPATPSSNPGGKPAFANTRSSGPFLRKTLQNVF